MLANISMSVRKRNTTFTWLQMIKYDKYMSELRIQSILYC